MNYNTEVLSTSQNNSFIFDTSIDLPSMNLENINFSLMKDQRMINDLIKYLNQTYTIDYNKIFEDAKTLKKLDPAL